MYFCDKTVNYIRKGLKREYERERCLKMDSIGCASIKKNKLNIFLDFKKTLCYNIRKLMRKVVDYGNYTNLYTGRSW